MVEVADLCATARRVPRRAAAAEHEGDQSALLRGGGGLHHHRGANTDAGADAPSKEEAAAETDTAGGRVIELGCQRMGEPPLVLAPLVEAMRTWRATSRVGGDDGGDDSGEDHCDDGHGDDDGWWFELNVSLSYVRGALREGAPRAIARAHTAPFHVEHQTLPSCDDDDDDAADDDDDRRWWRLPLVSVAHVATPPVTTTTAEAATIPTQQQQQQQHAQAMTETTRFIEFYRGADAVAVAARHCADAPRGHGLRIEARAR